MGILNPIKLAVKINGHMMETSPLSNPFISSPGSGARMSVQDAHISIFEGSLQNLKSQIAYTHTCTQTYTHMHANTCMHMLTYIDVHTYALTHAYMHMHRFTCSHLYMYHTCAHMHTHIHMQAYTHTHIHTFTYRHSYTNVHTHLHMYTPMYSHINKHFQEQQHFEPALFPHPEYCLS